MTAWKTKPAYGLRIPFVGGLRNKLVIIHLFE